MVRDELGNEGFGEAAPRPYVTGETVAFVLERLSTHFWPALDAKALPPLDLLAIERFCGETSDGASDNATRAALTTALYDLVLKRESAGIGKLLPPVRDKVRYSGVITASAAEKAAATARKLRVIGIRDVKIKVGFSDDVERVAAVREAIGAEGSIRLDANGAWDVPEAVLKLNELEAFGIAAVEQPLPRGDVEQLLRLKAQTPVPLMADESLVSEADARELAETRAVDYFNVRVSKCGGLSRCAQIARIAAEAGIGVQVGSQVGETAILSAAGRALAAWVSGARFRGRFVRRFAPGRRRGATFRAFRFRRRGSDPQRTRPRDRRRRRTSREVCGAGDRALNDAARPRLEVTHRSRVRAIPQALARSGAYAAGVAPPHPRTQREVVVRPASTRSGRSKRCATFKTPWRCARTTASSRTSNGSRRARRTC